MSAGIRQEKVICDRLRMNQILVNLLSNAVKYTPPNGKVTLSLSQKPEAGRDGYGAYTISVKDTGIGIKKENMPYIFVAYACSRRSSANGIPRRAGFPGPGWACRLRNASWK